jgi:hypothetical protein
MPSEIVHLSETSYITIDECPRDYFGDENKKAERVTLFSNGEQVLIWDVFMNEDTRYALYIDVEEKFRDGEWLNILLESDPMSLGRFNREYAVWTNVGEVMVSRESSLVDFFKSMNDKNILRTEVVLEHGLENKVIKIQ